MTDEAETASEEETKGEEASVTPASSGEERGLLRVETRLARAEAQILALQESLGEINRGHRAAKQRALMIRLVLLVLLLGGLVYVRAFRGGAL